jgi:hypothetical protein
VVSGGVHVDDEPRRSLLDIDDGDVPLPRSSGLLAGPESAANDLRSGEVECLAR